MTEQRAHAIYDHILKTIAEPLLTNQSTYATDLNHVCNMLFPNKFVGVYASDKIPYLPNGKYAILNLDRTGESGSHWVAIARANSKTLIYDSFGRHHAKIIPSILTSGNGSIISTDKDAEQKITEFNCGARCVSWLLVFEHWGPKMAKLI